MKRLIIISNLIFLFLSFSVYAKKPNSCDNLNFSFNVRFDINDAKLSETAWVHYKNSGKTAFWTDNADISAADRIMLADRIIEGQDYKVWLKFESWKDLGYGGNNKSGILHYYLENAGQWVKVDSENVNLSQSATHITWSSENISGFQCLGGSEPIPGPPIQKPPYCDFFPGPVQTWQDNTNNLITTDTTTNIYNANDYYIGFSNEIVETDYLTHTPESLLQGKCDDGTCQLNGQAAKQISGLHWDDSKAIKINNKVVTGEERTTPLTSYSAINGWTYGLTVEPSGHLILPVGEYWVDSADIRGPVTVEGNVVLHVWNRLDIEAVVNTTEPTDKLTVFAYNAGNDCPLPGNYPDGPPLVNINYAVKLNVAGQFNGHIYSRGPVTLSNETSLKGAITACQLQMSNRAEIVGNSVCFTPDEDYAISLAPEEDLSLTCDMQEVEFQIRNAGALAKDFSGSIEVTTDISQSGKGKWYQNQVFVGDIHDPLTLYPQEGIARAWLKSDWVGKIQVTGRIINDDATPAVGNFSFVPFKFEVAERALQVVAGKSRDITITAQSCSEPGSNDIAVGYTGTRFLDVSTQYTVPVPENGDTKHPIELRACMLTDLSNPNSECRSAVQDKWQDKKIALEFNDGIATAKLRYLDAGNTVLQIADPECSLEKGCEILPKSYSFSRQELGDWQRLEGTQMVYSRPYTFALCDFFSEFSGEENGSGTADDGRAFAMAGESVSVRVKPVAWTDTLPPIENNRLVTTSDTWCNSAPLTEHYYSATAGNSSVTAPLVLSEPAVAHSPAGGKAGGLQYNRANKLNFTFKRNNQVHDAKDGLLIEGVSWAEVGSFWLQADAHYLGMDVDRGSAVVGRIYPYHFVILDSGSGTRYPDSQDFVYMDQSFDGRIKVEAQNAFDQPTINYGGFAPKFLETVEIEAVDADKTEPGIKNSLTDRVDWNSLKSWGDNWQGAQLSLAWKPFMFLRDITHSTPKITTEDGPYNVDLGAFIKEREGESCLTDGCTFLKPDALDLEIQYCGVDEDCREPRMGVKFGQFNTRYGRMVMEDAAGRADSSIAIPLRVEFWDGSVFVTNRDDSVSEYDGRHSCRQIIANSADKLELGEDSNSYTQGSGEVTDGDTQSGQFVAVPHQRDTKPVEGYREQSRFWQKLVNTTPKKVDSNDKEIRCESDHVSSDDQPWLLYNWRDLGDENPSAVVTFGVYRGNDRIIYRGEKGINTLLN